MTLAAETRESVEASRTWNLAAALLRARRRQAGLLKPRGEILPQETGGLADLVGGRGGDDYGVRIDGWAPDSLEIFVLLWSAAQALNELMGISHKAWMALNFEVNNGRIWYTAPDHSGVADMLGIEPEEAKRLYAAGVEYVYSEIAGHELSDEWWKELR